MKTQTKNNTATKAHGHLWLVGVAGIGGGLSILGLAPRLAFVAQSLFLLVAFHVLGALLLLGSGSFLLSFRKNPGLGKKFDYGWTPGWMNGLGVAAMLTFTACLALETALPAWWPISGGLLLLAASFLGGNLIVRSMRDPEFFTLPLVRLMGGDQDHVLDAGCGAGRTSVALAPILGGGHITAVDRFDASYIEGGGRSLLEHNLTLAGLAGRIEVVQADLTELPFATETFDGAVSTSVFDHLGDAKQAALIEVFRVLKPGGRFLVGIWVPSWTSFLVGNVLAILFLTRKSAWRDMAAVAGFKVVTEGVCNYSWFMLLEKAEGSRHE